MALYTIADLHLSFSEDKPMDIFEGWSDYQERLNNNWRNRITEDDVIVVPGDLSWAMSLDKAYEDFAFLESLPGKKILLKGNHDYWWSTVTKIELWLESHDFRSISLLFNNSHLYGNIAIAGTRGWVQETGNPDNEKIYQRELGRLRLSLVDAIKKDPEEILVFLHYPPIYSNYRQDEVIDILREFNVKRCYFGHVHGKSINYAINGEVDGIFYKLVSSDYLQFSPYFILN